MAFGIKQGRSLFETTKEELEQLKGTPSPLSPAAAKTEGATPDQAKMTGTKTQKQAAFQRAQEPAPGQPETLQQQQRLTPKQGPAEFQQLAQSATEKADRLQQLGSLNTRVQDLIQDYQSKITTAEGGGSKMLGRTVNREQLETMFTGVPVDQLEQKQAALDQYAALEAPTQQDLVDLANTLGVGLDQLEGGGLASLYTGGEGAFAGATEGVVPTEVSVDELGLDEITDVAQLAMDLGIPEEQLRGMKPAEFQQALQDFEAAQANTLEALKAEYATASPNRRTQIMNEIRAMDVTGATAAEFEVEAIQEEVDRDLQVDFAGEQRSLSELLADETISDQIRLAAENPAALERLKETEPALAQWIETNQEAIKEMNAQFGRDVTALQTVQQEAEQVQQELGGLGPALWGEDVGLMTSEQLAAKKAELAANQPYQFLTENPAILAQFKDNPELFEQIKDLSREDLDQLKAATDLLGTDADVAEILGVEMGAGLILDPAQAARVLKLAPALSSIKGYSPAVYNKIKSVGPEALTELEDYANLSPGNLENLMKNAQKIADDPVLSKWINTTDKLGIPKDVIDAGRVIAQWGKFPHKTPNVMKFIDKGWIDLGTLDKITEYPGMLKDMEEQMYEQEVWEGEPSSAKISKWLFGKPMNPHNFQQKFFDTFKVMNSQKTPTAKRMMKTLAPMLDLNKDGRIDAADFYPELAKKHRTNEIQDYADTRDMFRRVQQAMRGKVQDPGEAASRVSNEYDYGKTYRSPLERAAMALQKAFQDPAALRPKKAKPAIIPSRKVKAEVPPKPVAPPKPKWSIRDTTGSKKRVRAWKRKMELYKEDLAKWNKKYGAK